MSFIQPKQRLFEEVVILLDTWDEYQIIFDGTPERENLLTESARWTFDNLHRVLLQEIISSVCRITDPPSQGPNRNLTLKDLPELSGLRTGTPEYDRLALAIESVYKLADQIRPYRNKLLGHLDYAVATRAPQALIPAVTIGEIKACLDQIPGLYALIGDDLSHYYSGYRRSLIGDANRLMQALTEGQLYRRDKEAERRASGELPPID